MLVHTVTADKGIAALFLTHRLVAATRDGSVITYFLDAGHMLTLDLGEARKAESVLRDLNAALQRMKENP